MDCDVEAPAGPVPVTPWPVPMNLPRALDVLGIVEHHWLDYSDTVASRTI